MVGRSNVGKSTLINALLKQKVARTSAAPGKTRLANYYLVDDAYYLVDLPGYGYARGGAESTQTFETLTRQYFDPDGCPGRSVVGVLHLIDSRHPDLESDAAAHDWLHRIGLPVVVVATKMDKLTRAARTQHLRVLEGSYDTRVLPVSTLDGDGVDAVRRQVQTFLGANGV